MATDDSDDDDDSDALADSEADEVALLLDEVEPLPVGSHAVRAIRDATRIREAERFIVSSPW
ncbi:hypothetical protein ABI_33100 [Asticcacaulis biprosthecium C19]|uniref:Uncharacterized protein n=1 Tax=Asticcacaulis biprosthecium C19 TaxID=715226 RepID=F4QQ07_9CAUL|nr:hypothetical protein ABI_33100 [Asticcacaulis biprosthecium C19]